MRSMSSRTAPKKPARAAGKRPRKRENTRARLVEAAADVIATKGIAATRIDDVVGEAERIRLGDSAWSRRVLRAIDSLWPVFRWDKLYIGGGNSARISTGVRAKFDENVIFIPNAAGMNGGVRAWALARPGRRG